MQEFRCDVEHIGTLENFSVFKRFDDLLESSPCDTWIYTFYYLCDYMRFINSRPRITESLKKRNMSKGYSSVSYFFAGGIISTCNIAAPKIYCIRRCQ